MPLGAAESEEQPAVDKDYWATWTAAVKSQKEDKHIRLAPKKEAYKVMKYFTHIHRGRKLYKLENNRHAEFGPHHALWTSCQHLRTERVHWKL